MADKHPWSVAPVISAIVLLVPSLVFSAGHECWFIDNMTPDTLGTKWGSIGNPYLEPMYATASSYPVSDLLDPDNPYVAVTVDENLPEYQNWDFSATLWMRNNSPGQNNEVTASLWVTQEGGLYPVASVTRTVNQDPLLDVAPYFYDFGQMTYSTAGEKIQLEIQYDEETPDTWIHWDGFEGAGSLVSAWEHNKAADRVICEYPSDSTGVNLKHPPVYWYDVTPNGARNDFHVNVFVDQPSAFTGWIEPAGWTHEVHKVGCQSWVSWYKLSGNPLAKGVTTRFQFVVLASVADTTWGDWTTTMGGLTDPHTQAVDSSGAHTISQCGLGYRVHVPKFRDPIDVDLPPIQDLGGVINSNADWTDIDNDGDLDVGIGGNNGSGGTTRIFENVDGTLAINQTLDGIENESSDFLSWGDLDDDGHEDLAMAGTSSGGRITRVYVNDGTGYLEWDSLTVLPGLSHASVAWQDFDLDGHDDLFIMGYDGTTRRSILYANDGPGTLVEFMYLTGLCYGSADWGDYDGDGDPDLLITGHDGTDRQTIFYENTGILTDTGDHGLPGVAFSDAAWGDFDRDGDLDLAFTGETSTADRMARVYENDGSGNFTMVADVMSIYRSSCAWGDYDLDGDLDVAFSGYTGTHLYTRIYENVDSAFIDAGFSLPGVRSGSVSWADVDCDCDPDFLLTGADWTTEYATLYENDRQDTLAGCENLDREVAGQATCIGEANVPNPFARVTMIGYALPREGRVRLEVFDTMGRLVQTVVDARQRAEHHAVLWDGLDRSGRAAASGVYFYRLKFEGRVEVRKMVLLR